LIEGFATDKLIYGGRLSKFVSDYPLIRKLLARLVVLGAINNYYPANSTLFCAAEPIEIDSC
jgi:hypothetical protein